MLWSIKSYRCFLYEIRCQICRALAYYNGSDTFSFVLCTECINWKCHVHKTNDDTKALPRNCCHRSQWNLVSCPCAKLSWPQWRSCVVALLHSRRSKACWPWGLTCSVDVGDADAGLVMRTCVGLVSVNSRQDWQSHSRLTSVSLSDSCGN